MLKLKINNSDCYNDKQTDVSKLYTDNDPENGYNKKKKIAKIREQWIDLTRKTDMQRKKQNNELKTVHSNHIKHPQEENSEEKIDENT